VSYEVNYRSLLISGVSTAQNNETDPFCKLVSEDENDPNNQHHRFCVAVSKSSHFKNKLVYPWRVKAFPCERRQISFKTPEGIVQAGNEKYFERMTRCYSWTTLQSGKEIDIYISRAYESNKVLVYLLDSRDEKIYLENLSTNVVVVE